MVLKAVFAILGTVFLVIGILGVFLPLLPATPFLLLASACYLRASDRLYSRLMNSKHLGAYIRNFRDKKGMPIRAKVVSIVLLWASLAFSIYRVDLPVVDVLLVLIGIGVTILILKIRTLRETDL